jgi:hypothetical protein
MELSSDIWNLPVGGSLARYRSIPRSVLLDRHARALETVLGERAFDPWARDPGASERDLLRADGIEP